MTKYNGHKNYNYWNVALWLANDEGLYRFVCDAVRSCRTKDDAARMIIEALPDKTPDGAPYTLRSIRAALVGWE
jgi:hypothetical protein